MLLTGDIAYTEAAQTVLPLVQQRYPRIGLFGTGACSGESCGLRKDLRVLKKIV
jgi:hypothetical protein